MRGLKWLGWIIGLLLPFGMSSQSIANPVLVSDVLLKGGINIYQPQYLVNPGHGPNDTFYLRFTLINDSGRDTTLYLMENLNEWVLLSMIPENPEHPVYLTQSGRNSYELEIYESIHFPSRPFPVQANENYRVTI